MKTLATTLQAAIAAAYHHDITPVITRPDPTFGDYTTNVALQLAKPLQKSPREIAETLAAALRDTGEYAAVEVAGPGFLNVRLHDAAILALADQQPATERAGQQVVIETNNPNPFKAMHIGHAFNAILADTIANLLEASGAAVQRVSYHGDVGAHVGKSMWAILRYIDGDVQKLQAIPANERNLFMSKMYAEGAAAYKQDDTAKAEITALAKQSFMLDDPLYKAVYEVCCQWSFAEIDANMQRIGNVPIVRRYLEREADARGVPIVRAHTPDVFVESDGALVFPGSKYGSFDNVFVTSQGLGLYGARDIGLITLKHDDFHAEKSYIVTAEEQRDYFKGVIKAAELAMPELAGVTHNISTGTVKLTTGKMSSRDGDVITIDWLFQEFAKAIAARGGEPTAEVVAGALRYQFLKVKIGSDVVFDVQDAVSLTGNTGSYLQYAHARACSIIEKSTTNPEKVSIIQQEDRALVRKLGEYHEVAAQAMRLLEPHHICTYLFELAQEFNRYYEHHQVIGSEHEAHRVGLVAMYAKTLQKGLHILGIHAPEKM
ncbi:MAG: arginine--tRNA ligase [Candidatus Saccharibacteria bacterium]|nr:arginine--tRNA ligase [Candidatus Saccharibacteria bacterium]